ncbi:DAK2 domain-containing protein, partial [Eggerthella sinensis]
MSEPYTANDLLNAIAVASKTLSERKDEINRLNVFPVPDGDTGTNMSLTLETVVENLAHLPIGAEGADIRKAITTGALMGARGNSGVITSQILRGLCEGSVGHDELNAESIDAAFAKSQEVAFQAVRKPVEGTILTVLRDSAAAAKFARKKKLGTDEALAHVVEEAYASVQRTPDLLPVLKENGVVDAGGFGLAIFFDAFASALMGKEGPMVDELAFARGTAPKVEIEQINDWEGSAYRYCTEFLVHSDTVDEEAAKEFLPTMGDCDLMVGMHPNFKVHVHSNRPDQVLGWFLTHDAQISEVHIHNMQQQSAARTDALAAEQEASAKPLGFVAVAAGEGNAKILKSLGVDVVVSGGQTMNPSTKDLLDAAGEVNADAVIILPNNKNIIMAAQTACDLAEFPCAVVPTKSVPEAFAALFGFDEDASLEENVESMTEAYDEVKTGEVTTAIKDSKDAHDNPIKEGDV